MEEVEYHEIQMWGWECPKCGHWNETEDDPSYKETIICEGNSGRNICGEEFKPAPG